MRDLPKKRKDLITACFWIDRRIYLHGKPEVLQLVPQKVYYIVRTDRPRLPALGPTFKGPNNLMRLPAGSVLYKRYVTLGKDSYLRRYLEDPEMAAGIGFVEKGSKVLLPIYEVVDSLAFASRKSDHMLAGYQAELQTLYNIVKEGRIMLAEQSFRFATAKEKQQLTLAVYRAEKRIETIELIVADHIQRQVNLNFAFERACSRLSEMAVILERIAFHTRTRNIRISAIQLPVGNILSELHYFNSKEIRSLIAEVTRTLIEVRDRQDKTEFANFLLSEKLRQAGSKLLMASNQLREEAEKVPEDEKLSAREMTDI